MDTTIHKLLPMYRRARAVGVPIVLATIVGTRGSTYRKIGAQMLFTLDHGSTGMLSGGCLEGDLGERARTVFKTGQPRLVQYDGTAEGDALWGLDSGCPGAMDVWLCLIGPATAWEPFASVERAAAAGRRLRYGLILESGVAGVEPGAVLMAPIERTAPADVDCWLRQQLDDTDESIGGQVIRMPSADLSMLVATVLPAPSLLVCGAGDDVVPLAGYAVTLGWSLTIVDSRPAYAEPGRFPACTRVVCCQLADLGATVDLGRFDAAVVMNHRLSADHAALECLARSPVPFIGLLGPAPRREALMTRLGRTADILQGRLRAPVGLKLGGRDEASVALAIAAELQAHFAGTTTSAT